MGCIVSQLTRRDFLRSALGAAATALISSGSAAAHVFDQPPPGVKEIAGGRTSTLPTRILGRTGERISVLGLGGENGLRKLDPAAVPEAIINTALDQGITYCDCAREYEDAEINLGRYLGKRRSKVFLATKVSARGYDDARRSIETSLRNLQTDHVDLLNVHHVQSRDDVDLITAKDGCLRALIEAREQGLARHVGCTGHRDPEALMELLRRHDFEVILMPMNAAGPHYLPFQGPLLDLAVKRNMGVLNMKTLGRGTLIRGEHAISIQDCINYALTLPVTAAVIGITRAEEIPQLVQAVRSFKPLSSDEVAALLERTKPFTRIANFFKADAGAPWPDR
jgi:predicted aldo/keto reductase-like oxidoreductase